MSKYSLEERCEWAMRYFETARRHGNSFKDMDVEDWIDEIRCIVNGTGIWGNEQEAEEFIHLIQRLENLEIDINRLDVLEDICKGVSTEDLAAARDSLKGMIYNKIRSLNGEDVEG